MRFPIKGTVFAVFFLLTTCFYVHLQPARAENTVTFKMVILPAEQNTVEDIDVESLKKVLIDDHKFQVYQWSFPEKDLDIFYHQLRVHNWIFS